MSARSYLPIEPPVRVYVEMGHEMGAGEGTVGTQWFEGEETWLQVSLDEPVSMGEGIQVTTVEVKRDRVREVDQ